MISVRPFPGTDDERDALLQAGEHHCACYIDSEGVRQTTCSLHQWWLAPAGLEHLVWARRLSDRLRAEEFSDTPPPSAGGTC